MRGVSFSSPGPGASASISCAPPTLSSGRMATARTTIPIPPSHCVICRQMSSAWECCSVEISPITVAPVVVKPDIDSNRAFTGCASVDVVP